ncbi:MAG: ABC transporter substrate-binding protein [Lachnospiraceae bacterium]|nr:ABC transporter substrate-binding protein [Lachnospiraceae bacterium]
MKNKVIATLLAASMVLTLSACGSSEEAASAPAETTQASAETTAAADTAAATEAAADQEPVTLRFMWWGGDERAEATVAVIEQFEALYPWITIEPEYGSSDGYQEKLTAQLNAGTEADIIQMGVGWMPGYVSSGADYFVDFNDYSDLIDLSTFNADFLASNGNFDGHQYGLPTGLAGTALIYNEELASSLGIDMSGDLDWDRLVELGKAVQAADPSKYLLEIDSTMMTTAVLRPYLLQLTGNTFFLDDTFEMGFTRDELVECLTYVKSLYDNNVVAPAANTEPYNENLTTDPAWINGTYVSQFCYTSTAEPAVAASTSGTFKAANLPLMSGAKDDGFYCNCPQYMVVSKNSANVEAAVMFLDYFYNNEEAAATLGTVRSVPPTTVGQDVCAANGLLEGIVKETVDVCQQYGGTYEMGLSTEEEPMAIMSDMLMQIAYGEKTPEDAADDAIELFQNYLDSKK